MIGFCGANVKLIVQLCLFAVPICFSLTPAEHLVRAALVCQELADSSPAPQLFVTALLVWWNALHVGARPVRRTAQEPVFLQASACFWALDPEAPKARAAQVRNRQKL